MSLDVYFQRERIGTLFPAGDGDYRFAYDPETVQRIGPGTQLLSASLPAQAETFSAEATSAYVDGLLPEGRARVQLARRLGLDPGDGYGMLAAVGGDCAGAVSFLPEGEALAAEPAEVGWLEGEELEELIAPGPARAGEGGEREPAPCCLPGIHHKLALVRDEGSGRWARPTAALPSTHIVKPETGEYPDLVVNEMFCTEVARSADLPVIHPEVATIGGRRCLVSRRYDRAGRGRVATRLHQESFCQALGFGFDEAELEGPGFAESCGLLRAVGREGDIPVLVTAAFCNYSLGNGDAHGSNFALLYEKGRARLAPQHDLTSTAVYEDPTHTGMVIAEDYDETAYLLELAQMSEACDFDFDDFRQLAVVTAEKICDSLEGVAARSRYEGWYAPVVDQIVELAAERAFGLAAESEL